MPPKKAKQGSALIVDGVDTSEMTRDQLEQFIVRIKEELDREREDRNLFQLERDKIKTYWEIARSELEELRAVIRNKDREIEECAENSEAAAKTHNQSIKHLAYEQMVERCTLQADAQAALRNAHAEYSSRESELLKDKRELRAKLRENELATQEQLRKIKLLHQEEISKIRGEFEVKISEMESFNELRLQKSMDDLKISSKTELAELEERKNKQFEELVKSHDAAFSELKNYYNDITLNNLGLISSLKSQMEETLKAKERAEKAAVDAIAEGKKLAEPLKQSQAEAAELKKRFYYHERDRAALANKTKILSAFEKQHSSLKWKYDILNQRFDQIVAERDELRDKFTRAIIELQQRAALRGALLEQKLQASNGAINSED